MVIAGKASRDDLQDVLTMVIYDPNLYVFFFARLCFIINL